MFKEQKLSYLFLFVLILVVLLCSFGTSDMHVWHSFALKINEFSLAYLYNTDSEFNHPALVSYIVSKISYLTKDPYEFSLIFRFFTSLFLIAVLGMLHRYWLTKNNYLATKDLLMIFLNPTLLLVACYHGNTDIVCIFFLLLAFTFFSKQMISLCAISLGIAMNIKLIALVFVPAFYFKISYKNKGKFLLFFLIGILPLIISFFAFGKSYLENVFFYKPFLDHWGILIFLKIAFIELAELYSRYSSSLILLFVICVVYLSKNKPLNLLLLISSLIFIIFANGFGLQYLAYPIAILYLYNVKHAFILSQASGLFMLIVYLAFQTNLMPFESYHNSPLSNGPMVVGILIWFIFLLYAIKIFKKESF